MNELEINIINDKLKEANAFIKKGQRITEMCILLLNNHTLNYSVIDAAFAWLENSNLSPIEILNKLLT